MHLIITRIYRDAQLYDKTSSQRMQPLDNAGLYRSNSLSPMLLKWQPYIKMNMGYTYIYTSVEHWFPIKIEYIKYYYVRLKHMIRNTE